jgi:hypothetical protein
MNILKMSLIIIMSELEKFSNIVTAQYIESLKLEMLIDTQLKCKTYNFDFVHEVPINTHKYKWEDCSY